MSVSSPHRVTVSYRITDAGHQWLAYSAAGAVSGDVVYINYGKPRDFEELAKMGVDVKGKIALMRYGEGFRGDKVREGR